MAISTTPGYGSKARKLPTLESGLKLPGAASYNPYAYVPGGSSPAVSKAIQNQGFKAALPSFSLPAPVVTRNSGAVTTQGGNAGGGGGGTPGLENYMSEAQNDAMWQLAERNYQDALAMGERSQFADPFRQALIQYGQAPSEAQLAGLSPEAAALARKYLDQGAVDAATKNPYSTTAQINRGFGQALNQIAAYQAERGGLGAGGANVTASELDYQRGLQGQTALNSLLGQVGTANQNWVDFQTQAAATRRQAQEDVATRLAQLAGYHALLDAQGNEVVPPPESYDYSGGAESIFQPAPDLAGLMAVDQGAGQWDAWTKAMGALQQAGNKAAPSPKTKQTLQKVRAGSSNQGFRGLL